MEETLDDIFGALEGALSSVFQFIDPYGDLDGALSSLENIMQKLYRMRSIISEDNENYSAAVRSVKEMITLLRGIEEEKQKVLRRRGRPLVSISEQELTEFLQLQFTQTEIAKMYGCSCRTIRRRIVQFGLVELIRYDDIADRDLDMVVSEFVYSFPSAGQKTIEGHLVAQGRHIQRWRIRESLLRVDPWGVEQRTRCILHRREYSVAGPNSLWHIDGLHKLIRWRIVVHGGIDGYS